MQVAASSGSMRPARPGLGSRTTSSASLAGGMHKRAADFELGEILGEGSYSTVFLATDKTPPHKRYALKVLDKKHIIKVCSRVHSHMRLALREGTDMRLTDEGLLVNLPVSFPSFPASPTGAEGQVRQR